MGIPKRMAVAMSGLVFTGGAALMIGAAGSASAEATVATPWHGNLVSACGHRRGCGCNRGCRCNRGCGCGGNRRAFHHRSRNTFSHRQKIIVINRNNNISRSGVGRFDQPRDFRGFDAFRDLDDDNWGDRGW